MEKLSAEAKQLIDAIRKEFSKPDAEQRIKEALKNAEQISKELREAARVDPADLHKPMTI